MSSPSERLRVLRDQIRGRAAAPSKGPLMSPGAKQVLATRQSIDVGGTSMSYLDTSADTSLTPPDAPHTVLFLHGNPTAAYLWRNVIPHVTGIARCVAPDLVGQGHSGKSPGNRYEFLDQYGYLCEFIDRMQLPEKIHLVIHDWGSALGFHWANEHRARVASITFMECLLHPQSYADWPEHARESFKSLRSPGIGEKMILEENAFVEVMLPGGILRELSPEEMEEYRRPFLTPGESRRPTLSWPRAIPFLEDGPKPMVDIFNAYYQFLSLSAFPKLYIHAEPGFFSDKLLEKTRNWHNLTVVRAPGHHFMQEDSPDQIGRALLALLTRLLP